MPPPRAPSNLLARVTSWSPLEVTLTWQDNATDESGFKIYRDTVLWHTVPHPNVQMWTDTLVAQQHTYTYAVTAYRGADESAFSNPYTINTTPPPPPAPTAPDILNVVYSPLNGVTLTWRDNSTNEDGFRINRSGVTPGMWSQIGVAPPSSGTGTQLHYVDPNLSPNATYYYQVAAYNAGGESPSQAQMVTTGALPPAPSNLNAHTNRPLLSTTLTWQDNSNNQAQFEIESSPGAPGNWFLITPVPLAAGVVSYTDSPWRFNGVYYYRIRAKNVVGYSLYSSEVSALGGVFIRKEWWIELIGRLFRGT